MTEDRLRRALSEEMECHQMGPDQYKVVAESGSEYEIDLATMECDCPDYLTRDVDKCKHLYKGLLAEQGLAAISPDD